MEAGLLRAERALILLYCAGRLRVDDLNVLRPERRQLRFITLKNVLLVAGLSCAIHVVNKRNSAFVYHHIAGEVSPCVLESIIRMI